MVARLESLRQRGNHGQSRRKGQRILAALERRQALFKRPPIGIVLAGVAEAQRILAVGAALKGGGEMHGRSDRAGRRVNATAGVNGGSFDLVGAGHTAISDQLSAAGKHG